MTKDYKYLRSFCSCKDCKYFQLASIPYYVTGDVSYFCGRVLSLGIIKIVDPMRDPCKQFILSLPSAERLFRDPYINLEDFYEDSSPLC